MGFDNVAIGMEALNSNTTGTGNTAVGKNAMIGNATGSNNIAIGFNSDVANNVSNSAAIGYGAYVNASNKIVLGNSNATTVGGYGNWSNYSDRRLKENIVYTDKLGLNFITHLKPVSYNYIKDTNKRRHDGLIAQDVEQTLKDLGLEFSGLIIDDDKDKTQNLSYAEFVIPLITAVQELNQQNQQLKLQLEQKDQSIEASLNEMKSEIEKLKQTIQSK
jgi:carbonic anhydrase/acetyltransferase-like protein (isoleucine patch superfamily)